MRDYSPRSSYESDNVPWSKAVTCRAVRTMIGQELRARYEVQQDLPHEMLTLLLQLNKHDEEASSRAYRRVRDNRGALASSGDGRLVRGGDFSAILAAARSASFS
jgi:hypothetical protein